MKISRCALFLLLALLPTLALAQAAVAPSFKATVISPQLQLLQGKGGNIVLQKGVDGLLLVDDDFADMSVALIAELGRHGGPGQLKFIVNTHWHGDHTGGNAALGQGVNIIAHDNVLGRMNSRQEIKLFNSVSEPAPPQALPDLTYPDAMNIHFNGDLIQLQHYPRGHTDGDTVVYFTTANLVHMGDQMVYPMFPFVDLGSGGNAVSLAANVGEVLARIDAKTIVIPGHGPMVGKAELTAYHQMLLATIAEVSGMKTAGLSLAEAQEKGLGSQWSSWEGGYIKPSQWIEFIYQSL